MNISNDHWLLVVVDNERKIIESLDSWEYTDPGILVRMKTWLQTDLEDKQGASEQAKKYTTRPREDLPRQSNGSDCGMFCCKYADFISKDVEIDFDKDHMPYFRARMAHELLVGFVE